MSLSSLTTTASPNAACPADAHVAFGLAFKKNLINCRNCVTFGLLVRMHGIQLVPRPVVWEWKIEVPLSNYFSPLRPPSHFPLSLSIPPTLPPLPSYWVYHTSLGSRVYLYYSNHSNHRQMTTTQNTSLTS